MTDDEIRAKARKALADGSHEALVEGDARVVRLDDPEASGFAVEAWVYLMDES